MKLIHRQARAVQILQFRCSDFYHCAYGKVKAYIRVSESRLEAMCVVKRQGHATLQAIHGPVAPRFNLDSTFSDLRRCNLFVLAFS